MDTAHIYIYGVIDYWQDDSAAEWGYVNLKDVKNQIDAQKDAKEIVVHIHSPGGSVTEGFAIHDFLSSQGKPITTKIEGSCYSIATVIALAGDKRQMTSNAEFMIHNPWGVAVGEKEEIQKYADQLEEAENQIADFYASKTNLTKEDALALMKDETFMNVEKAIEHGFITEEEVTMKAVALFRPEEKSNKKKKNMNLFKRLKNKAENKNSLDLTTAEGGILMVDTESDEPAVGDPVTDGEGKAIENGDVLLQNNTTIVVQDGKIADIKPEEEESEPLDEVNAKIDTLTKTIELLADVVENNQNNFKSLAKNIKSKKVTPPAAQQTQIGNSAEPETLHDKIQAQLAEKEEQKKSKEEK